MRQKFVTMMYLLIFVYCAQIQTRSCADCPKMSQFACQTFATAMFNQNTQYENSKNSEDFSLLWIFGIFFREKICGVGVFKLLAFYTIRLASIL